MLSFPLLAAEPDQPDAGELQIALRNLSVVGSVLYIAAHPDDENTRLLSYFASERGLRVGYLSLTRGDGGQNLIGAERAEMFGVLRTQELLAARRIDGAEQRFTRAKDFGYSKSAAETLRIWDREAVLGDVVWVVRTFRPDVIITRFPGTGRGGHGHHTASAKLAKRAFELAANPQAYPEQLRDGVRPWQAKRLLWNSFAWRPLPKKELAKLPSIDVGTYNPLLGAAYTEIAAESRSMHKSQGFGAAKRRGQRLEHFKLLAGSPVKRDLFEGIELSYKRIAGSAQLRRALLRARYRFRPDLPQRAIPDLLAAAKALAALPDSPIKRYQQRRLWDVVAACAGLFVEVRADDYSAVPGGRIKTTAVAVNRSRFPLRLVEVRWPDGARSRSGAKLPYNQRREVEHAVRVARSKAISQPYWLRKPGTKGSYAIDDPKLVGAPIDPPALSATFVIDAAGQRFELERAVVYRWTDPVNGERYRRVEVRPAVMVNVSAPVVMFPNRRSQSLTVTVKAGRPRVEATVRLKLPEGWRSKPASARVKLQRKGDERPVRFSVSPPRSARDVATLTAEAVVGKHRYDRGLRTIDYPHIEPTSVFPRAQVELVPLSLHTGGRRIGYIRGAGDEVAESLDAVGYSVTQLEPAEIEARRMARFDAVVLGVRAFNVHRELRHKLPELLAYARRGGVVLVQYNTNNRLSRIDYPIGPYPLRIGRGRVTDETATMSPVKPRHRVLSRPNRIEPSDFAGWVQERGLYFAKSWDRRYRAVLSAHDPGEKPLEGSLLVARVGRGRFVYTGLAFFRQLPAGVPGAYRLLANLLAR